MYIDKLKIKNFRCFDDTEVLFNYPGCKSGHGRKTPDRFKNVTLFIGPNGSGKTSIFKAVCLAVLAPIIPSSGLRADFFLRRPSGYTGDRLDRGKAIPALANSDIVADLKLSKADVTSAPESGMRVLGQAVIHRQGDIEDITTAHTNSAVWEGVYQNSSPAFFLVAYGANRRAANPEGYTERNRSPRYQRVASIFEEYSALVPFTVGYLELVQRGLLDEARRILNRLLPDRVELSTLSDRENRPLFEVHGVLHPYNALSDGYRGFIAWIWDLMVQMARVLPAKTEGNDLTNMSGIVIVDEIDLFLHPRWQRLLIEELADEFQNLQFLFSTHSPLVVGTLESENLRVLNRQGDASTIEQYQEEVEGKTPNELLTSIYFGLSSTRSPRSGTLSEQVEHEMASESEPSVSTERTKEPLTEEQKRTLTRMIARSRGYEQALNVAEKEVSETE